VMISIDGFNLKNWKHRWKLLKI